MTKAKNLTRQLLPVRANKSVLAAAIAALVVPVASHAQSATEGSKMTVEEVVVTARRKDESLAKVPIAVSAMGAEQMAERQVKSDADLQFAVPGLTIRQTQGNNSLTYSIRGQSADTFSGSASAVVAYLNEVPLTISGASTFYDLASVQVLKGPQGTLFGRNTTGGAVLYTTAKPTNETEGKITVRAGNYDYKEVEGMVNVPLVADKVLLRAAFNSMERDGYIENVISGEVVPGLEPEKHLGELDRDSFRLSLTVLPTDQVENNTVVSYSDTGGTNTGASYTYSVYTQGQTNNGFALNAPSDLYYGPNMDAAFAYPGAWAAYLATHPEAYAGGLAAYVEEQKRLGLYKTQHPGGAKHDGEDWIVTNSTTFDVSDNLRVKNILGISHAETDSEQPQLGAPFITILTADLATGKSGNELKVDSISDEFQVSGEAMQGDLQYIAGLYLQNMKTKTLWPQTYFVLTPFAPADGSTATNNFGIETDTQALYAQGNYSLTSDLRVTAGVRYTREDVTIEQLSQSQYYGFADQDETFKKPSWELGLDYDVSDSTLAYIKTRGSFRSGGFNGSTYPYDADASQGGNKFKEETVKDIEAGVKYAGSVMDRPARLNLAVYKQWVDDVQRVEFPDPPAYPSGDDPDSVAVTANVPKMEVKGAELEVSFMPMDILEVGVNGAYTDAEFTDGEVTLFTTVTYEFAPVANTPKRSGTLWAQVDIFSSADLGDMQFRVERYSQSSMWFSNTGDSLGPNTKLPSYELYNARLSWNNIMGTQLSGALFGKNVTDEEYFVGGMALATALGHNAAVVGEPAMYGMELSYKF